METLKGRVNRLLREKKSLRTKNLTMGQTIEKLEKDNLLLMEQNKKLLDEHEIDIFVFVVVVILRLSLISF